MKKGHFVVIEGTDGSGKATQAKMLRRKLQMMDFPHQVIGFPRYSGNPYGKLVGKYLNGDFGDLGADVGTYLVSLAYAGDRFLAKPQIQQWLHEGNLVIADRYVPSNKAYMSAKLPKEMRQNFIDWLDDLEYNINGIPREELVIFLFMPPKQSIKLVAKKEKREYLKEKGADIHENNIKYQQEAADVYLDMARQDLNWVMINCLKKDQVKTPQEVHKEIVQTLTERGILPKGALR